MSKKSSKITPLAKETIEIKMIALKEYIKLFREKLTSETYSKEKQLKDMVSNPTRNKLLEETQFETIAKNIQTIDLLMILESYTDTIKQNSIEISKSQGNVQCVQQILPYITSLIYGLDSVGQVRQSPEIKKMFFDYFQKDIILPPFDVGIDPQIKPLVVPMCSKEKIQKYMRDFSVKYQLEQSIFGNQQQQQPINPQQQYPNINNNQQYQSNQQYPQQNQQYGNQQYPQQNQYQPQQNQQYGNQQYPQQNQYQPYQNQQYVNQQYPQQNQQRNSLPQPNINQQGYQQQYYNAPPNWVQQNQGQVNFTQPVMNKSIVPWQQKQPDVPLQPPVQTFVPLGNPVKQPDNDIFGLSPNNVGFVPLENSGNFAKNQTKAQNSEISDKPSSSSQSSIYQSQSNQPQPEPIRISVDHNKRSLEILRSSIQQQNKGNSLYINQLGEMRNIALMI